MAAARPSVLRVLWVTLPVHALLPLAGRLPVPPDWLGYGFLGLHLAFPVILVITRRWWRGQGLEVTVVVVLDHLVTLLVLAA